MSRFFNETQDANQWAQKQLATNELDIKQVLEDLKQEVAPGTDVATVRLTKCRTAHLDDQRKAPLILRQDHSTQAALEAYRGLRTRLLRAQAKSGLRSIALTSSLPGEGKTLTVTNLGLCYSQLPDQRVLIIDADLRNHGLTELFAQNGAPGLSEVLTGQVTPDEAILSTDQKNLFVLPAGALTTPPSDLFSGPHWQEFLGWCGETFKVILVDTPPILPLADFELISAVCDGVVMVVRAHHGRREVLHKTAGVLDPKRLLGVVFNATETSGNNAYNYGYR
jgi:capsular exopolysaccharide synthesis family protein